MTLNDTQKAALALFAAREVGPKGSLEEMKAVCYCIRNRVRAGWNDGSWLSVLEAAEDSAAHEPIRFRLNPNNRNLQRLLIDVDQIFFGQGRDAEWAEEGIGLEASIGEQKYWMWLNRPVFHRFRVEIMADRATHPQITQMGLMMFFE